MNVAHIFREPLWDHKKEKGSDTYVKSLITEWGQNLDKERSLGHGELSAR